MPVEFSKTGPPAARQSGASKGETDQQLRGIAAELKAAAKAGNDPEDPELVCSPWAILARQVRSPEKYFPLRGMEVEVRPVADTTVPSMRDASRPVVASTIWARYRKGYRWVPRQQAASAS